MTGEKPSRQQRRFLQRKGSGLIVPTDVPMEEKSINVYVGIPTIDSIKFDCQNSIDLLYMHVMNSPGPIRMKVHKTEGSLLPWARNDIVEDMLDHEEKQDYLLFIDSDMIFHPTYLDELISHDKDIVSALYVQKKAPHFINAANLNEEEEAWLLMSDGYQKGELMRKDAVGMGFCLIRREVFLSTPYPWFEIKTLKMKEPEVKKWGVKEYRMWGEDFSFCHKAAEHGFETWLDCGCPCFHIGGRKFGPDDLGAFIEAGNLEIKKNIQLERADL